MPAKEKSTLTKFIELAMSCQAERHNKELKQLEKFPETPELIQFRDNLIKLNNYFMNDCQAILKAEKLYNKILSN